jgi:DNA helicase-2/ATP-dependent DNA helicase PcrA
MGTSHMPAAPHELLASLTRAQQEAVTHIDGPLLVLAGPGSGKTRVITHRVAWLLHQGIPPQHVLALTFTNKAAEEMQSRLARLVPEARVWVGTFHRFAARLLRQHAPLAGLEAGYSIYDTAVAQQVLAQAMEEAECHLVTPAQLAGMISRAKNALITPEDSVHAGLHGPQAAAYARYQQLLNRANAVDFDDLLMLATLMLKEHPELRATLDARYRYILVDEYQDTNLAQYLLVRAISQDYPNLAVTGDPDQSIYGWRGANLKNILEFEHDYPQVRVVRLEQNYRSTQRILSAARRLIAFNRLRKEKALFTENEQGPPVRLAHYSTSESEAAGIARQIADAVAAGRRRYRDFAVFYRVNALSRPIEDALRRAGIPYQIVNGLAFFDRQEIKDLLAYLMLLHNPRDDQALLRIINCPPREIGKTTVERLRSHASQQGVPLLEACRQAGLIETLPKRAAVAVARFVSLYDRLSTHVHEPVEALIGHVLHETGYQEFLKRSELPEDQERLVNLQELLSLARQYDEGDLEERRLEGFVESCALVNEADAWEDAADRVTLMTLHAAKGLEFPVVFIVAVENKILPHERSQEDPQSYEEERRLLFVGMTRAREELHLSLSYRREYRGRRGTAVPSPFLSELPLDELEKYDEGPPLPEGLADGPLPTGGTAHRDEYCHEEPPEAVYAPGQPAAYAPGQPASEGQALPAQACAAPSGARPAAARIATAADLAAAQGLQLASQAQAAARRAGETAAPPRLSPELFYQGMIVRHPEYGLGKVVALSGSGRRRLATVAFATGSGQQKFVLEHAPLEPVTPGGQAMSEDQEACTDG